MPEESMSRCEHARIAVDHDHFKYRWIRDRSIRVFDAVCLDCGMKAEIGEADPKSEDPLYRRRGDDPTVYEKTTTEGELT